MFVASEKQQFHNAFNDRYGKYLQNFHISSSEKVSADLRPGCSDAVKSGQQFSFRSVNRRIKRSAYCRLPVDFSFKNRLPFPVGTAGRHIF